MANASEIRFATKHCQSKDCACGGKQVEAALPARFFFENLSKKDVELVKHAFYSGLIVMIQRKLKSQISPEDWSEQALESALKTLTLTPGSKAKLTPAEKLKRQFPNLTDRQIEAMLKAMNA